MTNSDSPTAKRRIAALCRDCGTIAPIAAKRCAACRSPRTLSHPELESLSIAHIDCDAFYAAIEKRDEPSLADAPVIVGGGRRGVVSTACYVARTFGVRSAMPMFKALRLCPDAVVVKPDYDKYVSASRRIRTFMEELTPAVQPLSIDEAFVDLSGTERLHGAAPASLLARLARRIETEVGVTVSVGLSHNKFLAKVGSDLDKPRGFSIIGKAETLAFLADKPVSIIWGVGAKFAAKLERDGYRRIRDLRAASAEELQAKYGAIGSRLYHLSLGEDARAVISRQAAKSISAETTFETDLSDADELSRILWGLCEKIARRAKAQDLAGRVVTLKLRAGDFKTRTRRTSLTDATQLAVKIFSTANAMLANEATGDSFRLIGVGVSTLTPADSADPIDYFDDAAQKRADAERAVDTVRARYGNTAISSGRSLKR